MNTATRTGTATVTVVDGARTTEVPGTVRDDTVLLDLESLEAATGWELRAEGLCRGDVCVPRRPNDRLVVDDQIDLGAFAALMQRPLAYEPSAGIAVLTDSPGDHAALQEGRLAPPFTLTDLDGNQVSSAAFAGKKRLYVAWSSW